MTTFDDEYKVGYLSGTVSLSAVAAREQELPEYHEPTTTRIGINSTTPVSAIDIMIGDKHFTDESIRKWAIGDLTDIDFATGQESLVIEYLALIIVEKVLSVPKFKEGV